MSCICNNKESFVVGKNNTNFVWNIDSYLLFKQNRLLFITNKLSFAQEIKECFRNIFFDETVSSSLRTLKNDFDAIVKDIVNHLQALDKYYEEFQELLTQGCGFQKLADEFKNFSNIDCSPQARRDNVSSELKREFQNQETGEKEKVTCELHTKLGKRQSEKQYRLYFHPGKQGICDGKVIVVHIGKHL